VRVNVVEFEDVAVSAPALDRTLRTLARMMIRAYRAEGECVTNPRESGSSSTLTVVSNRRPDSDTNEAA
jgi:hypothetical protein